MVEVNGAYKYGRYEESWLKNLYLMSSVCCIKFLPRKTETAVCLPGQTNTIDYTVPCVTDKTHI